MIILFLWFYILLLFLFTAFFYRNASAFRLYSSVAPYYAFCHFLAVPLSTVPIKRESLSRLCATAS